MSKQTIYLLISIIILGLLVFIYPVNAQASNYQGLLEWMTGRILTVNDKMVDYRNDLEDSDKLNYYQARERAKNLIKAAKRYNHIYPNKSVKQALYEGMGIIETETRFVNFGKLDNGISFGFISMRWDTAQWVANKLNENYDFVCNKENPSKEHMMSHKYDRWYLIEHTEKQANYFYYYYYTAAKKNNGDLRATAVCYNEGINVKIDKLEPKWRNYYFLVSGRVHEYKE